MFVDRVYDAPIVWCAQLYTIFNTATDGSSIFNPQIFRLLCCSTKELVLLLACA